MTLRFLGQIYNPTATLIPQQNQSQKFQFRRRILTYRGISYINTSHSYRSEKTN